MYSKSHFKFYCKKLLSIAIDLLTVSLTFSVFVFLKKYSDAELPLEEYFKLWPFLLVLWLVFEKTDLYEGILIDSGSALGTIEEIRRLFYALSAIFITIGCANFYYRPNDYLYSRAVLIGTYLCCLVLLPFNRFLFRKVCTRFRVWGVPAVIIGSGETARTIFERTSRHPEYGIRPVGYFTDSRQSGMPPEAVYLGALRDIPEKIKTLTAKYAILAKDAESDSLHIQTIIKQYGALFPHLLFIPKSLLETCACVTSKDIGGILGLEIRHNLQIPRIYRVKRILDMALAAPCLIAGIPLMGLIAVWIKLDSPGPVFFKHQRITKNGRQINIYKFRTMIEGASEELNTLLEKDPVTRQEWENYGKFDKDPRITRAGRWLRRTSLDELPQLFNVLQGTLTLVGPRPIISEELHHYGENANIFDKVLPGITGLWQVSGRNKLTYEERVRLDNYYVNNWSVWLDLFILAKTVFAVLFRHGAR